jgi:protein O-mannosyl-transferase
LFRILGAHAPDWPRCGALALAKRVALDGQCKTIRLDRRFSTDYLATIITGKIMKALLLRRYLPALVLLASLALAAAAYAPGLSGYFMFDDKINITENTDLRITALDWPQMKQAALSGHAGIFGRSVSMLSFALDFYRGGLVAGNFKQTNLLIHLLCGLCVYFLCRLLFKAQRLREPNMPEERETNWISVAIAAAWLLLPLNLNAVLYIVQRMASLCALFTLLGIITYLHGRIQRIEGRSGWAWITTSFLLFTPLAALSKENGALLPLFLLLCELIFFRFKAVSRFEQGTLYLLFGVVVILPVAGILAYTAFNPGWITGPYLQRDFTLPERLMTEARVLFFYIRLAFAPDTALLGLYHDDIAISTGLAAPWNTFLACLGIASLIGIAVSSARKYPILAFGILFFLIGHSMESSVLALELVHEHRNYLPVLGLLVPFFYYLLFPLRHLKSLAARRVTAASYILLLAAITFLRADQWRDQTVMMEREVEHHPSSIRANIEVAAMYLTIPASSQQMARQLYARGYTYYSHASSLAASDTLGLFGLIMLNAKYSVPLEPSWLPALAQRIEHYPFSAGTGNLLVSMVGCHLDGTCKVSADTIETLMHAALRNPTMQGKARGQVLFEWSNFLQEVKHQPEQARDFAYAARDATPSDLGANETLIIFLLHMHRYAEAKSAIVALKRLDSLHVKSTFIAQSEQAIASHTNAP